ncbi:hypothetical protein ACQFX9_12950 [Aliinostoc sp. HNIBRCY26]|uniref:hypothetical protein n=1 Tax=Aliinostoc sp. HNIBRCY26 TaxID=3418997 RepID=UPI003D00F71A
MVNVNNEISQTEKAEEHKEKLKSAFDDLKEISEQNISLLTPVLPPESMEDFHAQWLALLKGISSAQSPQEIVLQSKTFLTAYQEFEKEFADRSKQFSQEGGIVVEFKPVAVPVQIDVNTQNWNWEFSLAFHPSIATPVGEFSVAKPPEKSVGITKLVVVHGDKVRYVTLAPGFEVFVPAQCGVKIKEANAPRLVVEVPQCGSQTQTAQTQTSQSETNSVSPKETLPSPVETFSVGSFPESSFPRASCGDVPPTDPSAYPLDFHPVSIDFSESNLTEVKNNFCRDAYALTKQPSGRKVIQVASFDNPKKAEEFRTLMESKFGSGEIGQIKTIATPP